MFFCMAHEEVSSFRRRSQKVNVNVQCQSLKRSLLAPLRFCFHRKDAESFKFQVSGFKFQEALPKSQCQCSISRSKAFSHPIRAYAIGVAPRLSMSNLTTIWMPIIESMSRVGTVPMKAMQTNMVVSTM